LENVLDKTIKLQNWSGSQTSTFQDGIKPKNTDELIEVVAKMKSRSQPFKIVGSSHSFSHLIADQKSDLVSIESLHGIQEIDAANATVTVSAGTTVKELSRELWDKGWALENLGDIEEQSLAGAISTGTHGTGLAYQNLAGSVTQLSLVSPDRGVEIFTKNSPEFAHLIVGTGAFGVVSSYTIKIVPKYHLKLDLFPEKLDSLQNLLPEWLEKNRNTEVFWFPGTDVLLVKLTNEVKSTIINNRKSEFIADFLENTAFGAIAKINRALPFTHPLLAGLLKRLLPTSTKTDRSYKVYATERRIKFQETEYSIPISQLWPVLDKLKALVNKGQFPTLFPIEFRFVKNDSFSLSPSFGEEERVYIAMHTYYLDSFYEEYFREAEKIFIQASGRPHWGKMFFADAEQFRAMYPKLAEVKKLRESFDSERLLLTSTMAEVVYPRS